MNYKIVIAIATIVVIVAGVAGYVYLSSLDQAKSSPTPTPSTRLVSPPSPTP